MTAAEHRGLDQARSRGLSDSNYGRPQFVQRGSSRSVPIFRRKDHLGKELDAGVKVTELTRKDAVHETTLLLACSLWRHGVVAPASAEGPGVRECAVGADLRGAFTDVSCSPGRIERRALGASTPTAPVTVMVEDRGLSIRQTYSVAPLVRWAYYAP